MKRALILMLAAVLILTGCGKEPTQAPDAPALSTSDPTATAEPQPSGQSEAPQTPAPSPEDTIPIASWLYSPDEGKHSLYETKDVSISISFTRSSSGDVDILLWGDNRTDREICVWIEDFVLNGTVWTGVSNIMIMQADSEQCTAAYSSLKQVCELVGYENIREISAVIRFEDYAPCPDPVVSTVSFPEGIRLCFAYETYMDMRADRQMLWQDEKVSIALLGCGYFLGYWERNALKGVLWIENRGDEEIPVVLSNVSVCGIVVETNMVQQTLSPNTSCIMEFSVSKDDLDTAGIRSIDSLALQILTSSEENTGGHFATGGSWYPVQLSQSGVGVSADEEGTVVYEDDLLTVRLVRAEIRRYEGNESYPEVRYTVLTENRRQEGICLKAADPMINGAPYRNYRYDWAWVNIANNSLGPESKGYMVLSVDVSPEAVQNGVPELSFLLQVLSQGQDSIFYTTAERIVLTDYDRETE